MTPIDFGDWMAQGGGLTRTQTGLRAQVQSMRINDKATDIELLRYGVTLAPQTVRIEWDDAVTNASDISGDSSLRKCIIFGLHGHPTLPDLDIEAWDTFRIDKSEYTVISVNRELIGQVQATCEIVG